MATDGARIYWSTFDGLAMFTVAGGALAALLPAPTGATNRVNGIVVVSDGARYVTQQAAVKRCTITSGKCVLTSVAEGPATATDVAVDGTFLY